MTNTLTLIESALSSNGVMIKELKRILPSHVKADYIAKTFITTIKYSPKLQQCDAHSLEKCLMSASEYGLPIDGKMASLLPFKREATLVIGYQGMIKLMYQSGLVSSYIAEKVCENDIFDIDYGAASPLTFKPCIKGDRGEVIGYISIARFKDGGELSFKYMTHEECMAIGEKHSPTFKYDSSPWKKHPEAMCLKTVIRQHSKFLPQSAQIFSSFGEDGHAANFSNEIEDGDIIDHSHEKEEFTPEVKKAPQPAPEVAPAAPVAQVVEQQATQAPVKNAPVYDLEDEIPHMEAQTQKAAPLSYIDKKLAQVSSAQNADDIKKIISDPRLQMLYNTDETGYKQIMAAVGQKRKELS